MGQQIAGYKVEMFNPISEGGGHIVPPPYEISL